MVLCALLIAGCSQGAKNPTLPSNNNLDAIPVIGLTDTGGDFNAIGLLGAYQVTVNPDTFDVTLNPKRSSAAIGDSYLVDGAAYFTIAPCTNCLTVKTYSLGPDGALIITFTASHPFAAGDPAAPPTGKNRNDLDLFDTVALVVPAAGAATPTSYTQTSAGVYTGICSNPDGYTTELKNVTSDPAAVPFFLVVDDTAGSATYNKLAQGTSHDFDIQLNIAGGAIPAFDIYLTMGYGSSAKKAQRLTPKYYNPEFNRKNAWKVEVTPPTGGWADNDSVTTKDVIVKVWDWQQNSAVSATVPYADEADTTTVFAESKVSNVSVEIPGMNPSLPAIQTPSSGTGAPADPLIYTVPVANEGLLAGGTYTGLVKVTDSRAVGAGTLGTVDSLIHNPGAPNPTEWKAIPEYATYQTFKAVVTQGCGPIVGRIVNPALGNYETIPGYADGQPVAITVNATSTGSTIALYEADFDYDGVTFTADASNTTGIFTNLGPCAVTAPCASNVPKTFQIAFQATDNCTPPNTTIFKVFTGRIDFCKFGTPVGDVTITVNRDSNKAFDMYGTHGPWTLSWTAVPGAAEYAVYVDTNPGTYTTPGWTIASLTDSLSLVGTSTTATFDCPFLPVLTAKKYCPGWTYVVRPRASIGNAYTECTTNSELAFILTTGFESGSTGINAEGWNSFWYYNSTSQYYGMYTEGFNPIDTLAYRWGYQSTYNYTDYVSGSVHGTPMGIPNSQRRIDTEMHLYQFGQPGIFFVTASAVPSPYYNVTTYGTMEWVNASNASGCYAYTGAASTYQATVASYGFVDVPTSGNVTWYTAASPNRQKTACNIDTGSGNTSHQYIGFVKINTAGMTQDYPNIDDFSILIY